MIICVSLISITPFIVVPIGTYFQLDPAYILFELTTPSNFMKNTLCGRILLPALRFFAVLAVVFEICRILSFVLACGACLLESTAYYIHTLKHKAMTIRHPFTFIINFQNYTCVLLNFSKTNSVTGQILLALITACLLTIIWFGYATVALRSTIPLPYYLILPTATLIEQIGVRQALTSGVNCHEQSSALLHIWKYAVLRTHNRKFMIKKIGGMQPIRLYARALSFNLFYLMRSTMGTVFTIIVTHRRCRVVGSCPEFCCLVCILAC
jgi:hypothetical protein